MKKILFLTSLFLITSLQSCNLNNQNLIQENFDSPINISINSNSKSTNIKPGVKALIIGDSHTAGYYGKSMDRLARETGATIETYGSCGASCSWWWTGQNTTCGYFENKTGDNKPTTGITHSTPILQAVIDRYQPDIVIVTMGGNFINSSEQSVITNVRKLVEIATSKGAKLLWAGPPKYDPAKRPKELVDSFYAKMEKAMNGYGILIDSRNFIDEYTGSDGYHYNKEGSEKWAKGLFSYINKYPLDNK